MRTNNVYSLLDKVESLKNSPSLSNDFEEDNYSGYKNLERDLDEEDFDFNLGELVTYIGDDSYLNYGDDYIIDDIDMDDETVLLIIDEGSYWVPLSDIQSI